MRRRKSKKKRSVHGIKNVGEEKGVAKRAKGRKRNDNIIKRRKRNNNNALEGEKGVARREKGRKRNNVVNLDVKRRKRDNNNAPNIGSHDMKGSKSAQNTDDLDMKKNKKKMRKDEDAIAIKILRRGRG